MTNIYFETTGCSTNFADSEQMAGLLKQAQFNIVNTLEDAYIIIFNTCNIKNTTETTFFNRLKEIEEQHENKLIIISGCLAQTNSKELKKYPLIGTNQIHHVVEVVEEALNDNVIKMLIRREQPPLNLPRIRKNPVICIIPISRSSLGACSFYKTKEDLISYPIEDIKKEAQQAVREGVKEIWLTAQDCGCYGFDLETNLAKLLQKLIKISGEFKIRIGMMNPDHLIKYIDEFLDVFNNKKIFQFLHLPVQSGNNDVLYEMNRKYTVEGYVKLINKIRTKFPQITLATDLITGYPS
ncbi:MAG: MiaB/RimO family radical SAM methylthiotransferase, partial [Nanoarchaeota archaeon]|nr:MiaB/RimO family radical SAM methylthiotransferase [Nanoarchaeota archaeon]